MGTGGFVQFIVLSDFGTAQVSPALSLPPKKKKKRKEKKRKEKKNYESFTSHSKGIWQHFLWIIAVFKVFKECMKQTRIPEDALSSDRQLSSQLSSHAHEIERFKCCRKTTPNTC